MFYSHTVGGSRTVVNLPVDMENIHEYPFLYKLSAPCQVVGNGVSEPSTVHRVIPPGPNLGDPEVCSAVACGEAIYAIAGWIENGTDLAVCLGHQGKTLEDGIHGT